MTEDTLSMTEVMKILRRDMTEISEDINKPDIYFEESRDANNSPVLMPLVTLKTLPCFWLKSSGGCTTCGYQRVACLNRVPTESSILKQVEYTIKNVPSKYYPLITFNSAGSFLDSKEISDELREKIMQLLKKEGYREFNFECRPEFLLNEEKLKQLKKYFDIVSVGIGLESSDDFIRNECMHKGTKIETYLKALNICKKYGVDADVYVQLGKPFLTTKEDIEDAVKTINFAFEKGFTRVFLMLCNIQPFTLTNYLWQKGKYSPPMLWAGIEVLKRIPEIYRQQVYIKGFNRAIPTPTEFPKNCKKCTSVVADKLIHWNLTGDYNHIEVIPECECLSNFKRSLTKNNPMTLQERINRIKKEIQNKQ